MISTLSLASCAPTTLALACVAFAWIDKRGLPTARLERGQIGFALY